MMKRGFTLLELIVVIIIIGVLATLGLTQYGSMVEKGRGAEFRLIFGDMRKLAYAYRLANGTINGITNADLNMGPGVDQIPENNSGCRPSHYFRYYIYPNDTSDPVVALYAYRCTAGGKSPQYPPGGCMRLSANLADGSGIIRSGGCTGTEPW